MSMAISGMGGVAMPQGMSAASGNWQQPPQMKMSNLFQAIDTDNSGSIDKSELQKAFNTLKPPAAFQKAGVDSVWNALDPNNTGSVSRQDFVNTMKQLMVELRQGQSTGNQQSADQTAAAGTDGLNSFYI